MATASTDPDLDDRPDATRVVILADTHWQDDTGADVPSSLLDGLAGVDLVVHCGDITSAGALERLRQAAAVEAVRSTVDPPAEGDHLSDAPRVVQVGGIHLGIARALDVEGPGLPDRLTDMFGQPVQVVAFGATHEPWLGACGGVLLVNPGSPTYPANGRPTFAVLELRADVVGVRLVEVGEEF